MVRGAAALVVLTLCACAPTIEDTTAVVSSPRLLAVQSLPAEVPSGAPFTLKALYVGPSGVVAAPELVWATCLLPAPSDQPGPVNPACFGPASADVVSLGTGPGASGAMPMQACQLFGPNSPPPSPGQPSPRPTDPDATGGYYLPVVVESPGSQWTAAPERVTCPPTGLTEDVSTAFSKGYHANTNPEIASLSAAVGSAAAEVVAPDGPAGQPLRVHAGTQLSLAATWATCPSTPEPCSGAETYLSVDPTTHAVVSLRESMVVSWYATGGSFAVDRSGRSEGDVDTNATNEWTAPGATGTVHLWVVLRDARGGVGWESYTLVVGP